MKDPCLSCTLPFCDQADKRCEFMKPKREAAAAWYRQFYQITRETEIERVRRWQKENKDRLNAYQRERSRKIREANARHQLNREREAV